MKYISFDLEIARLEDGVFSGWYRGADYGIACAATVASSGQVGLWHGPMTGRHVRARDG